MSKEFKGFTLIELLVVVAIIGTLAAVGVVAYNGYTEGAKLRTARSVMMQAGLAQTEKYSNEGDYYSNDDDSCDPTEITTEEIGVELFGSEDYIEKELGFVMCIYSQGNGFVLVAVKSACRIELDQNGVFVEAGC